MQNKLDLLSNLIDEIEVIDQGKHERGTASKLSRNVKKQLDVTIVIDSREQLGNRYYFNLFPAIVDTLTTGDYSILGFEDLVCVERKAMDDFIGTIITRKENFILELKRMEEMEDACVVIEGTYKQLINGLYTSATLPQSAQGLYHSLMSRHNIPFFFLEDFNTANIFTEQYLRWYAIKKEIIRK